MIERERFDNLSVQELKAVAAFEEVFDCEDVDCKECPFELEPIYGERFPCALVYGNRLYRRLTK